MTTFDRVALLRAADAATALSTALLDLLDSTNAPADDGPERPSLGDTWIDDLRATICHAASALEDALIQLSKVPAHPATVNPATDPEPPEGTVLAMRGQAPIMRNLNGDWGHWGILWNTTLRRADWTVLRWGWEGSTLTETPAEREAASCGPRSDDRGHSADTTPKPADGHTGPQVLATGDIVHLTEMGSRSIEVTLSWDTIPVDTREWCGKSIRLVAEDGDE